MWPRVILAVAVTAAIVIANEADRTTSPFDQAVIVFRHGFRPHDVLGVQKPLIPLPVPLRPILGPEVVPTYAGDDPLCAEERRPHICGLLLSVGGDGTTIASLAFPDPRIMNVPHDEMATVFVVQTHTMIGTLPRTYRRLRLYCRVPVLKKSGRSGAAVATRDCPEVTALTTSASQRNRGDADFCRRRVKTGPPAPVEIWTT